MRRTQSSKGHILVLGVFMILTLLAGIGYMYEVGRFTTAKMQAQNATDAAALASAVEMANYRNIATTHYALADMWYNMARQAAFAEYLLYMLGTWTSYAGDEFGPRSRNNPYQTAILAMTAGYHLMFHIQDGAVTRFLASYAGKRFYSHWLRADAQGKLDAPNGGIATNIASVVGPLMGAGDATGNKFHWRKERMRQAALIAALYNVMDPYDGAPLPKITVGNNLWDTFGNLLGDAGDFFGSLPNLLDALQSIAGNLLNPSAWLSSLPGTDPYTRVFGLALPSFEEEGKDGVPPRHFGNQIQNQHLGSTYARGLFFIPGGSIGRSLLFMMGAQPGPTPALPGGLTGAVLGQIMNLGDMLQYGQISTLIPPELRDAVPLPILTQAAATERPYVVQDLRLLQFVGDMMAVVFGDPDAWDWLSGVDLSGIPIIGNYLNNLLNPVMFHNDPWWYPRLAPAAGNITAPTPDAYPYH